MRERNINRAALFLIALIIAAVAANFFVKHQLGRAPGIAAICVHGNMVYLTENEYVNGYSMEGERIFSFKFSFLPDAFFFAGDTPVLYDYEMAAFFKLDDFFRPVKKIAAGKYDTVSVHGGLIYCVSTHEKSIEVFDVSLRRTGRVETEKKPYSVFVNGGVEYYAVYSSNVMRSFDEKETLRLDRLKDSGTVIKALAKDGKIHMVVSDEKFFSARYAVYEPLRGRTMLSDTKYYYPVDMANFNGYYFITDNTRNIVDVYSEDDKYLCRFGNEKFKKSHDVIFRYRKRLIYTGVVMNILIIAGFFAAMALYVISKNRGRKDAERQT